VHGQAFALAIPVPLTSECICCESRPCLWWSCVFFLVIGSVFGERAVFMLNLIVRGAGNWLLQNTVVTRKTDTDTHTHKHTHTNTHTHKHTHTRTHMHAHMHTHTHTHARACARHSEPQISLHALCTSVMSLSVRKYKTSAGSNVTLLRLSPYKHWASSVQWVCPASCKACRFQGKHEWLVGCAS